MYIINRWPRPLRGQPHFVTRSALAALLLALPLHSQEDTEYAYDVTKLREEAIDVGLVALRMENEVDPGVDVSALSKRIDALAAEVQDIVGTSDDPLLRTDALNFVLFLKEGFQPVLAKPKGWSFAELLKTKSGVCVPMATLYLAVAGRLGYPIHGVATPHHIFVRYILPDASHFNIEPTGAGVRVSDAEYIDTLGIKSDSLDRGIYMRTLSRREYISHILQGYAPHLSAHGRRREAVFYLEKAVILDPLNVAAMGAIILTYEKTGDQDLVERAHKLRLLFDGLADERLKTTLFGEN